MKLTLDTHDGQLHDSPPSWIPEPIQEFLSSSKYRAIYTSTFDLSKKIKNEDTSCLAVFIKGTIGVVVLVGSQAAIVSIDVAKRLNTDSIFGCDFRDVHIKAI